MATSSTSTPKTHEELKHHHKKMHRSLIKKLSAVWIILILLAAASVWVAFHYLLINKGSVLSQFWEQKINDAQVSQDTLDLTTYRSDEYGYEITFNPKLFKPDRASDLQKPNNAEISLTVTGVDNSGFGYVYLSAFKEDTLKKISEDTVIPGSDLLEKSANWYQSQRLKDLTDTSQFVSKERIKRWGTDAFKLTYKRKAFGKDVFQSSYVVTKFNKLFTIQTDYPIFGNSSDLVENWIDSIKFIDPNNPADVKAMNIKKPDLDEVKIVELSKPSVVQIVTINCVLLKVLKPDQTRGLKDKYEICTGGGGTGFMLGSTGIVATNGHVAKASFEDLINSGRPEPGAGNFKNDFYNELKDANEKSASDSAVPNDLDSLLKKNPSSFDAFMTSINDYVARGIIQKPEFSDRYFVKVGNDPIIFNKSNIQNAANSVSYKTLSPFNRGKTILDATLVGYDFSGLTALQQSALASLTGSSQNKKQKSSDVALIKLKGAPEGSDFPGLPLISSQTVKEGQSILVVGYPGLVSGSEAGSAGLLDETTSSIRPTITRGIISAIKQDIYGQTLLQTDASIEHGNSGGPAFNYQGDVMGIATYVITSGSGNYNFLRSTDDLTALMDKNQIDRESQSQTYKLWKEGLNYFWNGQFTKAKTNFEQVKDLYPLHPQADEYITNSQKGIDAGEDVDLMTDKNNNKELKSFGFTQSQITLIIAALMVILVGLGAAFSTYLIYDHKKKKAEQLALVQKLQQMGGQPPQIPPTQPKT